MDMPGRGRACVVDRIMHNSTKDARDYAAYIKNEQSVNRQFFNISNRLFHTGKNEYPFSFAAHQFT